jgi:hypothetical protein
VRPTLVCYLRENGPIAYAADMFGSAPRERADAMLSTDLSWYWKASGDASIARDWTHLTRWSLAALLEDLAARHQGAPPAIIIVGVDDSATQTPGEITDTAVATWIRGFGAAAAGPLHAVVSRPGPGGDLLFVAQQPPESVRALLQSWGIGRDKAERRAYPRLVPNTLEDLVRTLK